MDKRIIYTRPDGGVSIVTPSGEISIEDVIKKDVPNDAINIQIVDASEVPSDRTFRNAWKQQGALVEVDMAKARVIHLDKLREQRKPILAALDIEWMMAVAKSDTETARAIEGKRQALRDMPTDIDAQLKQAATPEELKSVTSDALTTK
jgi:hypothetical protein